MNTALLDDYKWLVSDAASAWLELATTSDMSLTSLTKMLRKSLTPNQTHLVLEQIDLRHRARHKFSNHQAMFLTRQLLEQATDEQIAAYKASRFPDGATIVDLCCGIGGDLMALAKRGPTKGIDRDPLAVLLAQWNSAAQSFSEVHVSEGEAEQLQMPADSYLHIDPDRRATGRRSTRIEGFSPNLDTLNHLVASSAGTAIKLAPATQVPDEWADRAELEWIGSRGECRQQVAWFGELAKRKGVRTATIVDEQSDEAHSIIGANPIATTRLADTVGQFIYEPHAVVLAADLANELARQRNLFRVSPTIAYFTSDTLINEKLLSCFEVLDVLAFDRRILRERLKERGIGQLEVKSRGIHDKANDIARNLRGPGHSKATLILFHDTSTIAVIARRVLP